MCIPPHLADTQHLSFCTFCIVSDIMENHSLVLVSLQVTPSFTPTWLSVLFHHSMIFYNDID